MKRRKLEANHSKSDSEDRCCDLPDLVLHTILRILPLKTLFVSKCVSKRWNAIITTRFFKDSYVTDREPKSTLLLTRGNNDNTGCTDYSTIRQLLSGEFTSELPFTMLDLPFAYCFRQPYTILSSSHGLLLCRSYENGSTGLYAICNPVTRDWIVLQPRKHWEPDVYTREAFVAKVDKSSSILISYTIVRLNVAPTSASPWVPIRALSMKIYDSDTGNWTQCEVPLSDKLDFFIMQNVEPVSLNDIIHWETARLRNGVCLYYAIAHDPYKQGENQIRMMLLPTAPNFRNKTTLRHTVLGVCHGKLQYLQIHYETHDMAIWVLEDYDEEKWELKHMITGIRLTYCDDTICHPLYFHPLDSNIIYMRARAKAKTSIMVFDVKKRALSYLSDRVISYGDAFPFVLPLWPAIFDWSIL